MVTAILFLSKDIKMITYTAIKKESELIVKRKHTATRVRLVAEFWYFEHIQLHIVASPTMRFIRDSYGTHRVQRAYSAKQKCKDVCYKRTIQTNGMRERDEHCTRVNCIAAAKK